MEIENRLCVENDKDILHFRIERRGATRVFGRLRRPRLKVTVERDGSVVVVAPPRLSMREIDAFVAMHRDWILEQRERMVLEHAQLKKQWQPGEEFLFLGQPRRLSFEDGGARVLVEVVDNLLVLRGGQPEDAAAAIKRYYEQQARLHIDERVAFWARTMGLVPSGVSYRCQKTRWGSCSPEGHVSLNWKLICAPEYVIDYVVIHELAHLEHANHSPRFWSFVARFDPEYKTNRRWLRIHHKETEFLNP